VKHATVVGRNEAGSTKPLRCFFALAFAWSWAGWLPVPILHTAVNAWSPVIPAMVMQGGSNLRPFRFVVGILVVTALALLVRVEPAPRRDATPVQP
jgi:hypothetical protein